MKIKMNFICPSPSPPSASLPSPHGGEGGRVRRGRVRGAKRPKAIIFIALALFLFTTPAFAAVLDIKEVQSKSDITAWLVEDHSVPVIALEFGFASAGAAYDPVGKHGLARLASNTMDEGAGDLDATAFQKALRDHAITLYFNSSRDHFGGTVKTLTKNKDKAFELLRLALTQPRFDEEPVERMRTANESRIRQSVSDPGWRAARLLNDRAFEGHVYARNSGGSLSSLTAITRDDLQNFHATKLGRNNVHIAVAGDITATELSEILDQIFGDLPVIEPPTLPKLKIQNSGQIFEFKHDIPQTMIEIIQPGIPRTDRDYQAAQVMNFILGSSGFGSRLTEEIRGKRGLTYGIYSNLQSLDQIDLLGVSTSTENKNAGQMLALIRDEFEKMRSTQISAKELKTAQTYLIGALPLSLTSTDKIAGLLLSLQMDGLPIDYLDQRERKIESLTTKDILKIAQRLLDPAQFVTILVGAPQGVENVQSIKELPDVE